MVHLLLLCAMLFQAGSPTAVKPIIDNEHVTVWDVTDSAPAQPNDAVVITTSSGSATFVSKGTTPKISGRAIVIDLKDQPATAYKNTTSFPLAFPRPGSKKVFENDH